MTLFEDFANLLTFQGGNYPRFYTIYSTLKFFLTRGGKQKPQNMEKLKKIRENRDFFDCGLLFFIVEIHF